ncbi:hypothetical protein [Salinicola peritrichatus]|uniref:hypothetical protein n=1 Tax=Salinicola peritrichatus TaxID=1267424 RepID=UPI000DA169B4|nr:hypothetical protein [Salinicola peritrichatus]
MAGNELFQQRLALTRKHTYTALQGLVVAMAKVIKSHGKRTWFGKDKGRAAYEEFLRRLSQTVTALVMDRQITAGTDTREVVAVIKDHLRMFEMAHPNWQDAYGFAEVFFDINDPSFDTVATIERLRLT